MGEFNYVEYREKGQKKNPLWKGFFTILAKLDVLEYVSWTNEKYKNKTWLKIV